MRGDSLRDFYAKTLAVLGLGLLAGAGALVDYWPVNEELPAAPAATGLMAAAPVLPSNLTVEIPRPVVRAPRPRPVNFIFAASDSLPLDVMTGANTTAVTLESPPVPDNFILVEAFPAAAVTDEALDLVSPPIPDGMTEESRRLFADTLRRTKEHLTAAKLFLNDAMSGMVGAFRKVSPFFTTTAMVPGL